MPFSSAPRVANAAGDVDSFLPCFRYYAGFGLSQSLNCSSCVLFHGRLLGPLRFEDAEQFGRIDSEASIVGPLRRQPAFLDGAPDVDFARSGLPSAASPRLRVTIASHLPARPCRGMKMGELSAVNEALPFDEPEDDVAVARAEPAHGPQAVEDGPSMWMRAGRPDGRY